MSHVTCKELITFLHEYLEEELAPNRKHDFEQHLRYCPSCRAYVKSYRETVRLTKTTYAAAIEDVPAELVTAILATIARGK